MQNLQFQNRFKIVSISKNQIGVLCRLHIHRNMHVRRNLATVAPYMTLSRVILLLEAVWPQPKFSVAAILNVVNYHQDRDAEASRSHRKRRMTQLQQPE